MKSATAAAVEMVRNGSTPYAAAKACKIAQSTVHRALERLKAETCPMCGQIVKEKKSEHC